MLKTFKLADAWYRDRRWLQCLRPLSTVFAMVSTIRRSLYRNSARAYTSRYPVIVVGNITAGGTGKTPLVIYLAQQLCARGYRPGIVSRGFGSKAAIYPFAVTPRTGFREAGEEALMIARHTQCPVIIDPDRVAAVQMLENSYDCNIIISDDGMQHYRLNRSMEIAVVDGQRGFGNGYLLPAGPLREKPERLASVDIVVCNGETRHALPEGTLRMDLEATHLVHLANSRAMSVHDAFLSSLTAKKVHAVAGIGNPERFFNSLCSCGFDIITHIFRDHHMYNEQDISFNDGLDVVMTEKDAVKCHEFCSDQHWYLKVTARLPDNFMQQILEKLQLSQTSA
jgi:tetraacyldisaccharide 4'-kinase